MTLRPTGSPARLRKRELFASLCYSPHEGQVLVHRSTAPRRVLVCGVRWGKSTCGVMEAIAAILEPRERSTGWLVAPNFDLSARILQIVVDIVQRHFKHRIVEWNPREHRLVVCNLAGGRSQVRAMSAENPSSLLGEGLDWVIVDEASRLKRDVWQQHLSQRLVDRQGWALLMSTPRGPGWFYLLYKRGQKYRDAAFESWTFPSWTNPHLSRELIEAERASIPENTFAQEYEAKFLGTENEACERCGWPNRMAPCVIFLREPSAEIPKCPECERYVNAEGKSVMGRGKDGSPYITIIRCDVSTSSPDGSSDRGFIQHVTGR